MTIKCNYKLIIKTAFGGIEFLRIFAFSVDSIVSKMTKYRKYWIVYVVLIILAILFAGTLAFFSLVEDPISSNILIFTLSLPLSIYLLESLATRKQFIKIFHEIEAIKLGLRSSQQEHILQVSLKNRIKMIVLALAFIIQLLILYLETYVFETLPPET